MSCISVLHDKKNDCISVSFVMKLEDYINLIDTAYNQNGAIEHQRNVLKTKTGITIRKRMIQDIQERTILPPVVIGAVNSNLEIEQVNSFVSYDDLLSTLDKDKFSIIDGMQRTTALRTALGENDTLKDLDVRVELWLAKDVRNLIYRMLVLNTGQVPWDIKRQLLTIYSSIAERIKNEVPDIKLIGANNDSSRRSNPGEFQQSIIIEAFMVFSTGSTDVDIKDQVAQDFARMNITTSIDNKDFFDFFIKTLNKLVVLDATIFEISPTDLPPSSKIKSGKDIFTSAPAVMGFFAAASVYIYGEPGFRDSSVNIDQKFDKLVNSIVRFVDLVKRSDVTTDDILGLLLLNERLGVKSGKIGDYERSVYFRSFLTFFDKGEVVVSLEQCWTPR